MSILGLEIRSHNLSSLKTFYGNRLGFPIVIDTPDQLTFQIGSSQLVFTEPDNSQQPTYLFSIAVPDNRFEAVARTLAEKASLLSAADESVIDLAWRDTQAVYLLDPVGNIVEFAARSTNAHNRQLTAAGTLNLMHVGLPVHDLDQAGQFLQSQFDLDGEQRDPGGDALIPGGTDEPFLLVQAGRSTWLPTGKVPQVHPVMMTIVGSLNSVAKLLDYPYYIHIAKVKGLQNSHVVAG